MADAEPEDPPIGTAQNAADAARKAESYVTLIAEALSSNPDWPLDVTVFSDPPEEGHHHISWLGLLSEPELKSVVGAMVMKIFAPEYMAAVKASQATKYPPKRVNIAPFPCSQGAVEAVAFWGWSNITGEPD